MIAQRPQRVIHAGREEAAMRRNKEASHGPDGEGGVSNGEAAKASYIPPALFDFRPDGKGWARAPYPVLERGPVA